jgi:hypothetical protein
LVLPRLRHREPPCDLLMPPCQKSSSMFDGQKSRCNGATKITQSTSRMDTTPW